MSIDDFPASSSPNEETSRSRFTYRDLKHLGQYSVSCPLRVIALIDFDCFYAQCESVRLGLNQDKPLGVQQFTAIIAMNYAARKACHKKVLSTEEVKRRCPEIHLQHVATWREGDPNWAYRDDVRQNMATDKACLDPYRIQSRKALELIKRILSAAPLQKVEKASIDEIFVDLSAQVHQILLERYPELLVHNSQSRPLDSRLPLPWTTLLDWKSDKLVSTEEPDDDILQPDWDDVALNIGSEIIRDVRQKIFENLKYTCSAGIARNKPIAKLGAGHNKPNGQTVIRDKAITFFLSGYNATKIRGLGGKLGARMVEVFQTERIKDLLSITLKDMQSKLGRDFGTWVYNVIRGSDHSEVVERTQIKSMLSAKTFTPKITGPEQAERWFQIFAADLHGRMEELNSESSPRRPKTIAVHHHIDGRFGPTRSKQMAIPPGSKIDIPSIVAFCRKLLDEISQEGPTWPCLVLSVSISDFEDCVTANHDMKSYLASISSLTRKRRADEIDSDLSTDHTKPLRISPTKRNPLECYGFASSESKKQETSSGMSGHSSDKTDHEIERPSGSEAVALDLKYSCPKCNKQIPAHDVLEHLDWHVALDVQDMESFSV